MNPEEFGILIRTLRKSSIDQHGNPWTRKSLSRVIHLSVDQLGRLERGDRKLLDKQLLILLSSAFNLTILEKKELLEAATGLKDEELYARTDPVNKLNELLLEIKRFRTPAMVLDSYSDLVAANGPAMSLYAMTPEMRDYIKQLPAGTNMMKMIYSPEFGSRELFGPFWREVANIEMLLFRRATLCYRHRDYFKYIISILLQDRQFDVDWYTSHRHQSYYNLTYELFEYIHPRFGPVSYLASETRVPTKKGNLYLLVYNPVNKFTVPVFEELYRETGNAVARFAPWPDKSIS